MLGQRIQGFKYALAGLKVAWREEAHFKIEIGCAALVLILGFFLGVSSLEFALLILTIGVVLTAETLNTALEELCDKFQPTQDSHIEKIKDLAAAAVLLAAMGALFVGLFIFLPYL